jgi:hypothetical protein
MLRLRAEDLVYQESDGETVLLDLRTSTYLVVNPTGTVVFPALVDGATREQLLESVVDAFDVGAERAGADLDAFLADLEGRGLLEQT